MSSRQVEQSCVGTDLRAEWSTLTTGAGIVRLADFGVLRVDGRDAAAWLQKLITADVSTMSDGAGAYALLLEAKGHVLADFVLLKENVSFWFYTSRPAFENLLGSLRRAIFREKVILTDVSDRFGVLALQGPTALAIAQETLGLARSAPVSLSTDLPFIALQFANSELLLVRHLPTSMDGFDLLVPPDAQAAVWDALIAHGARPVGLDALNVTRVEAGIPWYGADFDENTLAPEARLDAFIAQNKGCFPGQEAIARIRNLGHVNRLLVQFQIEGDVVPSRGDLVFVEDKEAGWVTSPVWSYARNTPLALGYIRREWALDSTRVQVRHGSHESTAIVRPIAVH